MPTFLIDPNGPGRGHAPLDAAEGADTSKRPRTPSPSLSSPPDSSPARLVKIINRLAITSTNPLACLSSLPPELKALIVEHVYELDQEEGEEEEEEDADSDDEEEQERDNDDRVAKKPKREWGSGAFGLGPKEADNDGWVTDDEDEDEDGEGVNVPDREGVWKKVHSHNYEEWGVRRLPILESLSRVNREFAELAFPFLWKSVNLGAMSNHDLLYFLKIVIPRHGKHIVFLEDVSPTHSDIVRPEVPPYISDALSLPPQLEIITADEPPSNPGRLDWAFFGQGEEIKSDALDGNLIPMGKWQLQRMGLLCAILSRSALPSLMILHFVFEGDSPHLQGASRELLVPLKKIGEHIVEIELSVTDGEWSDEDASPLVLTESWVCELIGLFPHLIKLAIDFPPGPTLTEGTRQSLVDSIASLPELENLSLRDCPWVTTTFAEANWIAPIALLHLSEADLSLAELNQLLLKLPNLETLDLEDVPNAELNAPSKKLLGKPLPLSNLKNLVIATLLEPPFLASFINSPIEELEIGECPLIKYSEWESFLDAHRSTLKSVIVAAEATFSAAEKESMEVLCFARGVKFEAESEDEEDYSDREDGYEDWEDEDEDEDDNDSIDDDDSDF